MSSPRVRKVADRIQVVVAEMLERRIKDPRLGFLTVTDVRVTGDTQHATVFYTVMGGPDAIDGTAAALTSATGVLRSEVGRQLGMRHTPTLEFILDGVPENARHIEDLLSRAREHDAEVSRQAATAAYAGEADPYKHRDEGDDPGADPSDGTSADPGADPAADPGADNADDAVS
ncbi:MAG: 30S ribosome-binding factor RbfA [Nocardioidaceae bacterium]